MPGTLGLEPHGIHNHPKPAKLTVALNNITIEDRSPSPESEEEVQINQLENNGGWKLEIEVYEPSKLDTNLQTAEQDDLDRPLSPLNDELLLNPYPQAPMRFFQPPARGPRKSYGYNFGRIPGSRNKRRALVVGIRGRDLHGCHNDAEDMKEFLIDHCGFEAQEVMILKDDDPSSFKFPTRDVVLDHLELLVEDAMEGDSLFLHFSGHGGQIDDLDGDEADRLDEVIVCADGQIIVDDELHDLVVKPLPRGCRLTAVFDCCASETGLDIVRTPHHSPLATPDRSNGVLDLPNTYESRHSTPCSPSQLTVALDATALGRKKRSQGDVIMWSACLDSGNSQEVVTAGGMHKGAMTQAFVQCLKDMPNQSYAHLLDAITKTLRLWGVNQQPQLSTAQRIDQNEIFRI